MVVKTLFDLFEYFEYALGSDGAKIILLKLLIFLYRILKAFGIQFYAPVAISVKDEATDIGCLAGLET